METRKKAISLSNQCKIQNFGRRKPVAIIAVSSSYQDLWMTSLLKKNLSSVKFLNCFKFVIKGV